MNKNIIVLVATLVAQFTLAVEPPLNVQHSPKINNELFINATEEGSKFDKLLIQTNVFQDVIIDNKVISAPKKLQDIKPYLQQITTTLLYTKKATVKFKYGNMEDIILQLPYLGTGNHAYVFEILDKNNLATNKVFKLNIKQYSDSLKAGVKESYNYIFWNNKAVNYSFSVAKTHFYADSGLFCIKQKNNGISLTKFLLEKNLIFVVDKANNINNYKPATNQEIKDLKIEKVCVAVLDLLSVMKNNPNNCSSISPNNIFIELENDNINIKTVELIDYGISVNKMKHYSKIENFNQYLELAAERMTKYIRLGYGI